ncbi:hypothetical protein [Flavobacterium oreochromis]|uniref:Uncharacterized protein n=1 Tax=Flavobacterium oreochromis TaxID=2906078 RepID=A0ABW8P8F8_9FLAO|nr:hypothetical protein [Flavobacterium oreochromis]
MLTRMCKEVAGFSNAVSHNLGFNAINNKKRLITARGYDYFSNSDLKHLQDIDNKFKKGHQILMMIDSNMIENIVSYSYNDIFYNSHWVVYEGGLKFFDKNGIITTNLSDAIDVTFKIFAWGYDSNNGYLNEKRKLPNSKYLLLNGKYKISSECFKSTFYGYIEPY